MFGHLPTAFQQKLAAVGREEYLGHMRGGEGTGGRREETGGGREGTGGGREGKGGGREEVEGRRYEDQSYQRRRAINCAILLTHQPTGLNSALMCTRTHTDRQTPALIGIHILQQYYSSTT